MINLARVRNPELLIARAEVEQAEYAYELARLAALPDLTLALSYGIREDSEMNGEKIERPDFLSASMSIPVPLWKRGKQDKEAAEMSARKIQAMHKSRDMEAKTATKVDMLMADLEGLDDQIILLETRVLPQAKLSLESARAAYRTGKVDFLSLVNANITLYQVELRLERLRSNYLKAMAELDMIS